MKTFISTKSVFRVLSNTQDRALCNNIYKPLTIVSKRSDGVAGSTAEMGLFILVLVNRVRFFSPNITLFYWIQLMKCATFQKCTKYKLSAE